MWYWVQEQGKWLDWWTDVEVNREKQSQEYCKGQWREVKRSSDMEQMSPQELVVCLSGGKLEDLKL